MTADSVLNDRYFEQTMMNADIEAREVYRESAFEMDGLQSEMLAISDKEKPYDIYICYKETDESGNRTEDSIISQRIYDMLTSEGYRVFFSRESLKNLSGSKSEPYIFAALKSA